MTLHAKIAMPDLQRYLKLIKSVEYIFVFLTQKVFYSGSFSIASFKEEVRMSLSQKNLKWKLSDWYLIHTWSDNDLKGTIVNRAFTSFHGGLLEISILDVSCSGLIHGDITTSNIMVHAQGNLFFIDFGLR